MEMLNECKNPCQLGLQAEEDFENRFYISPTKTK